MLFMLDFTRSQVDGETEFQVSVDTCVVSLSVISLDSVKFINFSFNKMIYSFFKFLETAKDG